MGTCYLGGGGTPLKTLKHKPKRKYNILLLIVQQAKE